MVRIFPLQDLADLENPGLRRRLETARRGLEAETGKDLESLITKLGDQYV